MKICGKASEVSWWMEPLGGPLSTQCTPLENYWRPPLGFSEGEPLATSSARPKPRNSETQVFGLMSVLGCGLGFAFRKSLGGPSIFSLGSTLSTLRKLPRGFIHHATSSAFPQIVPVYSIQYTTQCTVTSGQVCYWAAHRKLPAAGSCSASLSSGGQLTNSANWNSAN